VARITVLFEFRKVVTCVLAVAVCWITENRLSLISLATSFDTICRRTQILPCIAGGPVAPYAHFFPYTF